MNFQCPTCSITLQAEPEFAGKAVKCPSCSTRIEIPEDFGQFVAEEQNAADGFEGDPGLPELNLSTKHGAHPASVSLWIGLLIGIGFTAFVYFVMMILPQTAMEDGTSVRPWIAQFFLERGWPQYASTFLTGWCIGILVLKALNIQKQRRAMLIQALPDSISQEVNVHNLKEFHDNLLNFPTKLRNTYMVNRIRKALEYFYIRQNNPETAQMVNSLSDIDNNKVIGSYAMVKVFLWAVPIMGFIGTVLGIGAAIGKFGDVLGGGGGDGDIMSALTPVLGSMGMAFDTTLLALVFSIILAFPASALQGQEEDVVTEVDDYCIDNFLKRLDDGGAGKAQFDGDADFLRSIGESIASSNKDVMERFEGAQKTMSTNLKDQTESAAKIAEAVEKQIVNIETRAKNFETSLDKGYFENISNGINNLNQVLRDLNGKQVVVKKKWFGK